MERSIISNIENMLAWSCSLKEIFQLQLSFHGTHNRLGKYRLVPLKAKYGREMKSRFCDTNFDLYMQQNHAVLKCAAKCPRWLSTNRTCLTERYSFVILDRVEHLHHDPSNPRPQSKKPRTATRTAKLNGSHVEPLFIARCHLKLSNRWSISVTAESKITTSSINGRSSWQWKWLAFTALSVVVCKIALCWITHSPRRLYTHTAPESWKAQSQ